MLNTTNYSRDVCNVLVIGSGGAGLRSAIEAKSEGLAVSVLGKRNKNDAHTVLAAGGINASFGNIDKEDCWEQHFADTYIEGYGIAEPLMIEILAKKAKEAVNEIDSWGANFERLKNGNFDQRYFGAHTYRRTCYAGDYTGREILNSLLKKAIELKIPIHDDQYVSDLLINDGVCFGAISINQKNGDLTIHFADSVILATGGHTRIWKRSTSRAFENTGDGIYLGLKSGCRLTDMEMVQFHPTGMVKPDNISGTLVTEAVRGEGGKLLNSNGERYMKKYDPERMELSTRDRVAFANYIEIMEGRCTENGGLYLDISHKSKDFIIDKLPSIYRQFINYQMLDISKEPMEIAPTAHYSMGGIEVDPKSHWTGINGLYAIGEVTGGLHGANRLGGNSLADILVFGKIAGHSAATNSKNITSQMRSEKAISYCIDNILNCIQNGTEIIQVMQHNLETVMWDHCGVVRDHKGLTRGLDKLNSLKDLMKNIDVRITSDSYEELIKFLNFKSSIISAEATLLSAIKRKESRGAHQRSDFNKTYSNEEVNYKVSMESDESLRLKRSKVKELSIDLKNVINQTKEISSYTNRLNE